MSNLEAKTWPLGVIEGLRVVNGGLGCSAEDLALTSGLCLELCVVVDLFKNARHSQQEGWLVARELGGDHLGVAQVANLHA